MKGWCFTLECNLKTFLAYRHPKGHFVPFQKHQYHEIVFYKSGKGRTTINGEIYEYTNGSLAVIPKGIEHDEISVEPTEVFFCLFESSEPLKVQENYLINCDEELVNNITDIFLHMQKEYGRGYDDTSEMLNLMMAQLLIWISRYDSKASKTQDETLRYIHTYLKEYCTQKINFDILAESIGYSPSRMRHLYTEKFGQPMQQQQINFRINQAKQMLVDTNLSIKEVGLNCGFHSSSKFVEVFRERCQITPQRYRNVMKKEHEGHFVIEN